MTRPLLSSCLLLILAVSHVNLSCSQTTVLVDPALPRTHSGAVLPSLLLGPVRVESLPALAEDLSLFQKALGCKVDAIVGLDVLRKSSFSTNYKTKEILFGSTEGLTFSAPFDTEEPVVTILMQIENRRLRLVIDTGGPDLMFFQSQISGFSNFQTLATQQVVDVCGAFQRRQVLIPEAYLGKERISSQTAFIAVIGKMRGMNLPAFWALGVPSSQRLNSTSNTADLAGNGSAIYLFNESSPAT